MKDLHSRATDQSKMTRELAATLRGTLDRKYAKVLGDARDKWNRKFAGKDPSDACVTVRISSPASGSFANNFLRAA